MLELWGIGDLALATPFLRAAAARYEVTLLAKPHAQELQPRLWPGVRVMPFVAPWTAFRGKYQFRQWPWRQLRVLRHFIKTMHFDYGVSARPDPRDHLLLRWLGVKHRLGFPVHGSGFFLSRPLASPPATTRRAACWQALAEALELNLDKAQLPAPLCATPDRRGILVHTGAAQPVRVWPLERYHAVIGKLRQLGWRVQVVCDPGQREWWLQHGEAGLAPPHDLAGLMALLDEASLFIGNDSGPGHLAAALGVPTFTIFGPQLPELFAPAHPAAEWVAGHPCPHKPCFDACHYSTPHCLMEVGVAEVIPKIVAFVNRHVAPV